MAIIVALVVLIIVGLVVLAGCARVVKQYERGLVFRFGRALPTPRQPGLMFLLPIADRLHKVNTQIVTMPIPAQDGITRDNVTVRVDAVVYFTVIDPMRALVNVQVLMPSRKMDAPLLSPHRQPY